MAAITRVNRFLAGFAAGLVALACLWWAPYLVMYANFGETSFWDGDCSSNEPWFAYVAIGSGVPGIALALYASYRAVGLALRGRGGRAWLFVAVAVATVGGWASLVTEIEPESRTLPPSACSSS